MSKAEKRHTLDIIEQADLLLVSMRGQMDMAQERAEKNGLPVEWNDALHMAVVMKTMIDSVRACLDEAASSVTSANAEQA